MRQVERERGTHRPMRIYYGFKTGSLMVPLGAWYDSRENIRKGGLASQAPSGPQRYPIHLLLRSDARHTLISIKGSTFLSHPGNTCGSQIQPTQQPGEGKNNSEYWTSFRTSITKNECVPPNPHCREISPPSPSPSSVGLMGLHGHAAGHTSLCLLTRKQEEGLV